MNEIELRSCLTFGQKYEYIFTTMCVLKKQDKEEKAYFEKKFVVWMTKRSQNPFEVNLVLAV